MIGMDTFGLRKKRVQIRYPFSRICVLVWEKDIAHIGWNGYF